MDFWLSALLTYGLVLCCEIGGLVSPEPCTPTALSIKLISVGEMDLASGLTLVSWPAESLWVEHGIWSLLPTLEGTPVLSFPFPLRSLEIVPPPLWAEGQEKGPLHPRGDISGLHVNVTKHYVLVFSYGTVSSPSPKVPQGRVKEPLLDAGGPSLGPL